MKTNILSQASTAAHSPVSLFSRHKSPVVFVWAVWVLMLGVDLSFVLLYGRNIPLAEDWYLVAPLTGNESNILKWLWGQNNEHRIPLPKVIFLCLLKITGGDFRSGMVLNILMIALLAALLIRTFYVLRGNKMRYTDAFFPLVLLHNGNWENFYWSWEFTFILATILFSFQLITIVRYTQPMKLPAAISAALYSALLPLCGANGLLYLLPAIPWLAYTGYMHLRDDKAETSRRQGFILLSGLAAALLLVIAYFIGYVRPYWNPLSPSIKDTIITSIKFMALSFGPAVFDYWIIFMLLALSFTGATFFLLLSTLFRLRGIEFIKALGLFFFLGGTMVFALAMGYGRAAFVNSFGLPQRYVLLAVPILIICYSTWELFSPSKLRTIVQGGLFLLVLLLLIPNTKKGFNWRDWYLQGVEAVTKDIKAGVPQSQLVERHQKFLLRWDKQMLSTGMQQLKESEIGPFKNMKADNTN